jgi:hypothetical protein
MISKRTEISFSLYARLDIDQEEQSLIQEFVLAGETLGSHLELIPGQKEIKTDNMMNVPYCVAELIPGKEIKCYSFTSMMGLEKDFVRGMRVFAEVIEHARQVRRNHETVYDFAEDQAAAQAAE